MHKKMIFAAVALIGVAVLTADAVVAQPRPAHDPPPPIPRESDGAVTIWHVTALLQETAAELDVVFVYNPDELARHVVVSSEWTRPTSRAGRMRVVGTILARIGYSYVKVESAPPTFFVMRLEEVGRWAHPLAKKPSELPEDVYWGTLVMHLRHADASSVQRAILNLVTRPGGVAQPVSGANAVMISDMRPQLEHLYHIVAQLDAEPSQLPEPVPGPRPPVTGSDHATAASRTARTAGVPPTEPMIAQRFELRHVAPIQVRMVLEQLFDAERQVSGHPLTISLLADRADQTPGRLFVRGPESVVKQVADAIALIDVEAEK